MARKPRIYVDGIPQHVIQRGNNRQACFYEEADYAFYLQQLKEAAERYDVRVHAFVLMTNHVHLLLTPSNQLGISRLMQAIGRSYVRYINITYQRTGTLWEGRFKSCLVGGQSYFLTVSRYIELNPVRAGMVSLCGEYPWSSFRHNGMGVDISLISEHEVYCQLGRTRASRVKAYRGLFEEALSESVVQEIQLCSTKEWVIGDEKFKRQIEEALGRKIKDYGWGGDRKSERYFKSNALTP